MDLLKEEIAAAASELMKAEIAVIKEPSNEALKDDVAEKKRIKQDLITLLAGYQDQEDIDRTETNWSDASEDEDTLINPFLSSPARIGNVSQQNSSKLRLNLPKFDGTFKKSPSIFLSTVEKALTVNQVPKKDWITYLGSLLLNEDRLWYAKFVETQEDVLTWVRVKELLVNKFTKRNQHLYALRDLSKIQQGISESSESYSSRFLNLMFDANMEENDASVLLFFETGIKPFLKKTYCGLTVAYGITTITEAINLLKTIDSDTTYDSFCTHCKRKGHTIDACWSKTKTTLGKRKLTNGMNSPYKSDGLRPPYKGSGMDSPNKSVTCWSCKEVGHYSNACPKRHKINMVSSDFQTPFYVNVRVNDLPCEALIDSGADISCLDIEIAKKLDLVLSPYEKPIYFANSIVRDLSSTEVKIDCGNFSTVSKVLVFNITSSSQVLLGRDLMEKFGMEIRGIPLPVSPQFEENDGIKFDDELSVEDVSRVTPQEITVINQGIKPALESNKQLIRAYLCTLPYGEIFLDTGDAAPVNRRQYPIPIKMKKAVKDKIESWLDIGTISKAPIESPWNSPLIAVPKKDDSGNYTGVRLCLDTRGLNSILQDVQYTLPLVKEIFDKISGFKIASRLDLADSFNQLPLNGKDRIKTTFTFEGKRYMFNGAPFGVKTLTSHLQRILSILLEPFSEFCIHFVDDIIVFSSNIESHITHLNLVIAALNSANFVLRIEKCLFGFVKISILGHIVSGDSIQADSNKLSAFSKMVKPSTGKQLESFLGVTGYLRDYIPLYSRIAAPLEAIRKVKGSLKSVWKSEHDDAIDNFKKILSSPPVISAPDFTKEFHISTDASINGVGAVLFQKIGTETKYNAFASSSLNKSQRNYPITKLELLAVVFAVRKFRNWIWGSHFTLYTDHMSLVYLFTLKAKENRMISNWADELLEYNFTVVHIPGIKNILPDALSRIFYNSVMMVESLHEKPYVELKRFIKERFNKIDPSIIDRESILTKEHIINHQGADQLFKQIFHNGFYWDTLRADCEKLVSNCRECLSFNVTRKGYHPLTAITAKYPFDHIAIDLFGPFKPSENGYTFVLLITDIATGFVVLRALSTKSAFHTAERLYQVFCDFGFPKILQSDNGTEFVNQIVKSLLELEGVSHRLITPYHPEANGAAERNVSLAKTLLFKICNGDFSNWESFLPAVQIGLNARISSRHKSSPFTLFFGRKLNSLTDYSGTQSDLLTTDELIKKNFAMTNVVYSAISDSTKEYYEKVNKTFNKSRKLIEPYVHGDIVMMINFNKTRKQQEKYVGPYEVIDIDSNGAYTLQDMTGEVLPTKVASKHLKKVRNPQLPDSEVFEVEEILKHKGRGDSRRYFVSWKGYGPEENSWIPVSNFNTMEIIDEYHKSNAAPSNRGTARVLRRNK